MVKCDNLVPNSAVNDETGAWTFEWCVLLHWLMVLNVLQ